MLRRIPQNLSTCSNLPEHNHQERTEVKGYEGAGEYHRILEYDGPEEGMLALAEVSAHCFQYISWECREATIWNSFQPGLAMVYWESREGELRYYWGGAPSDTQVCACGVDDTCAVHGTRCNCDADDQVERQDAGYLTDLADIPIRSFFAGDTGEWIQTSEWMNY